MKKNKRKENNIFAYWKHNENYKVKDKEGNYERQKRFVGIPHSLLMNENFMKLSFSSKVIYIYMLDYAMDKQCTTFPKSIYIKITTIETFKKALKELAKYGFIEEKIISGKSTRTPNQYMFSDKWKTIVIEKDKRKCNFNKKL